jgi:hypothetical protein
MRVETFSLAFDDFQAFLSTGPDVARLEAELSRRLEGCHRLLRWAIVTVDAAGFCCEGAYLTTGERSHRDGLC